MFLDLLGEDSVVYKLLGPVLVKQDKEEAVSTVKNRADYMENELKRYESDYTSKGSPYHSLFSKVQQMEWCVDPCHESLFMIKNVL